MSFSDSSTLCPHWVTGPSGRQTSLVFQALATVNRKAFLEGCAGRRRRPSSPFSANQTGPDLVRGGQGDQLIATYYALFLCSPCTCTNSSSKVLAMSGQGDHP